MKYILTKKAGSMILRKPQRRQFFPGDEIPAEYFESFDPQVHVKSGTLLELDDDAEVTETDLGRPDMVDPVTVGVPDGEFMPEAQAMPGERKDEALEALKAEQEAKRQKEKDEATLDEETGKTPDGVVQREEPEDDEDEDFDDEYSDLTEEEMEALRAAEGRRLDYDEEDED